jgi:Fe-Mn family superoxide dismutase
MSFSFPELPYGYDALEPHIDTMTMEIHYSRHHKAYFTKFMDAIEGTPLASQNFTEIFGNITSHPAGIRNNGGGFYNHNVFWNSMSPNGGGNPTGDLGNAINAKWGSFDKFKEEFANAAATRFGSGFAWLIINGNGELEITSTANQDNPLMNLDGAKGTPLLCLDVWEHAYYLKYQNKRPDYINAFWNVANWTWANEQYTANK